MNKMLCVGIAGAMGLLSGCDQQNVKLGGGGSGPVTGSAGGANSQGASAQLEHCAKPLGTLAVEEDTAANWYLVLTTQYKLPATTPLLRLMIQQSNCFVVVDRGRAMANMQGERELAASGELRAGSKFGKGQMVAADYIVTPTISFAQQTGAGGAGAVLSHFGGAVGAVGALAGGVRTMEAETTLLLTDARSGVQVSAAVGNAKKNDFSFGALGAGGFGGAAIGGYQSTPEGKLIAGAFMDSYNQMVKSVREYAPQKVAGGLGTGGQLGVDGSAQAQQAGIISVTAAQSKLIELGLLSGKADGIAGPGTHAAISKFQKIKGLPVSGQLDAATSDALSQSQ
jgi:hypothetical protein